MRPTSVLATLTGRDRPGVTAAFFAALAAHDVDVRDVEQVVIRDRLIMSVLFDLRGDAAPLRTSATSSARALGLECEVVVAREGEQMQLRPVGRRSHVVVLGHPLRPGALSHIAQCIADLGGNIESMSQLSGEPVSSIELLVRADDARRLCAGLVRAADETGVDIALEPSRLRGRAKRLVLLDLDTTVVQGDPMAALAERSGFAGQLAAIAVREKSGELDSAHSLRERAALLAGTPASELVAVRDQVRLAAGVCSFVGTLRRLGYHVGAVSGGFSEFTEPVTAPLQLDFAEANVLEIVDGRATGRVVGEVMDRAGKAAALLRFAAQFGVPGSQTVAVGGGPAATELLQAAGLAIAFNAKAALRAATDLDLDVAYLDTVLAVFGVSREHVADDDVE